MIKQTRKKPAVKKIQNNIKMWSKETEIYGLEIEFEKTKIMQTTN